MVAMVATEEIIHENERELAGTDGCVCVCATVPFIGA